MFEDDKLKNLDEKLRHVNKKLKKLFENLKDNSSKEVEVEKIKDKIKEIIDSIEKKF